MCITADPMIDPALAELFETVMPSGALSPATLIPTASGRSMLAAMPGMIPSSDFACEVAALLACADHLLPAGAEVSELPAADRVRIHLARIDVLPGGALSLDLEADPLLEETYPVTVLEVPIADLMGGAA